MEQKNCKSCKNFLFYYIKRGRRFRIMDNGRCGCKPAKKTEKICKEYEERNPGEEKAAAIKTATEYLAKIAESLHQLKEVLRNQ